MLKGKKPEGLKRLGVDEIGWAQGKREYCRVLVNIETHEEIGIVKSRNKEEMRKVLEGWGPEVLGGIEYVSIDLWRGYETLVHELMPNAEVVANRFHVMKVVNEELDKQRQEERRKAKKIKGKGERES